MIRKPRLFTPGLTPLLPAAQSAMAAACLHPRGPELRALFERVLAQLKQFIGTSNDVLLFASSGTGAMEAAMANITSPGDRILVLSAGRYGERWSALGRAYLCDVEIVSAPYGETFSLDAVRKALKIETRAVFMQATETSTGVRHCVPGVAQLLKDSQSEALLIVDAITGLGTTHLQPDAYGVDILIGASHTALMSPAGLSFLSVSERAWDLMDIALNPRYYFGLRKARKNAQKADFTYTPPVSLLAALSAALDFIAAQAEGDLAAGRIALIHNAEICAAMTRAAIEAMGLSLFAPGAPSAAVTTVVAPPGADSSVIVRELESRFAATISNGQGKLEGQIFRIAHLGLVDPMDMLALIGALEQIVVDTLHLPGFSLGQALAAAQTVYAARSQVLDSRERCPCGRGIDHCALPAGTAASSVMHRS